MEKVELPFNAPRRMEVEAGTTIRVAHGRVWLTLTDLAQDIVLPAGQTFCAPHAGRMVVEAWDGRRGAAVIVVDQPGAEVSTRSPCSTTGNERIDDGSTRPRRAVIQT